MEQSKLVVTKKSEFENGDKSKFLEHLEIPDSRQSETKKKTSVYLMEYCCNSFMPSLKTLLEETKPEDSVKTVL